MKTTKRLAKELGVKYIIGGGYVFDKFNENERFPGGYPFNNKNGEKEERRVSMQSKIAFKIGILIFVFLTNVRPAYVTVREGIKTDLIYLIDVSGSMIGLPLGSGAKDIFSEVVEALKNHVKVLKPGTRVFIITFSDGLHDVDGEEGTHYEPIWSKEIKAVTEQSDKEKILKYIANLNRDVRKPQGHGWQTAIYDSMKITLEMLDKLREDYEKTHPHSKYKDSHVQEIILFTDGKDTRSRQWDFEKFLQEFNFRRAEDKMGTHIFLKIITLGKNVFSEKERKKIEKQQGMEIIDRPRSPIVVKPSTSPTIPWKEISTFATAGTISILIGLTGLYLFRRPIYLRVCPADSYLDEKRVARIFELKPGDDVKIGKTTTGYPLTDTNSFFRVKRKGRKIFVEPTDKLFDLNGRKIENPFSLKEEVVLKFEDKKIKLRRQDNV